MVDKQEKKHEALLGGMADIRGRDDCHRQADASHTGEKGGDSLQFWK